jgi:hypothetical protein
LSEEELTRAGLSRVSAVPEAGPKVNENESPFTMLAVEVGLPFVMVMNRDERWPTGKMGGEMLTTGVMAEEVCAVVTHGSVRTTLITYANILLMLFISLH